MCDHKYESPGRVGEPCPYDDRMKYGLVKWEYKKYCIFHAPLEAKKNRIDVFWDLFFKLVEQLKHRRLKEWDFEGFIFPDTGDNFKGYKFPEKTTVNFRHATFSGAAYFSNAQFSGEANFREAQFSGEADFRGAQFSGYANFFDAKFSGEADFERAQFSGEVNLNGAEFSGYANFVVARFSGYANFIEAQFSGEVYFSEARFSQKADFTAAEFCGDAYFSSAQFSGLADFDGAQFSGKAYFSRAQFSGNVFFNEAIILQSLFFEYARFSEVLSFAEAKLGSDVDFSSADLHSQVNFRGADISSLNCSGAVFRIPPYFGDVGAGARVVCIKNLVGELTLEFKRGWRELYIEKTDIKNRTIKQKEEEKSVKLVVEGGKISGLFTIRAPLKSIHMSGAAFPATMSIAPKDKQKKPSFTAEKVSFLGDTSIEDVMVEKITDCIISGNMRIIESDLSEAHFDRVDLSRIDFVNVKWIGIARLRSSILQRIFNHFFKNRLCRYRRTDGLFDEISIDKDYSKHKKGKCYIAPSLKKESNEKIEQLEEMYRQVASSYESRRRYGMAGHFKAGEFEIRRFRKERKDCKKGENRKDTLLNRFILLIYRWSSFYGEEVFKPFMLLVFFVPILSTLLMTPLLNGWVFDFSLFQSFLILVISQFSDFSFFHNISLSGLSDFSHDFFNLIPYGIKGLYSINFEIENDPNLQNCLCNWQRVFVYIILFFEKMLVALFTSQFIFALRRRVKR